MFTSGKQHHADFLILSALGACSCSLMLNLTEHLCSPSQMVKVSTKIKNNGPEKFMDSVFC